MTFHRGLAKRPRTQPLVAPRGCRLLRSAATLGLLVLVFGVALPLVGVLADDPVPLCCAKGRCCCADRGGGPDEAPCLRRGCGCGHSDELLPGGPLRLEAVLSASPRVAVASPARTRRGVTCERSIARAEDPPVPPPKGPLSA